MRRPLRMYRGWRRPDTRFENDEDLYMRFRDAGYTAAEEEVDREVILKETMIPRPEQSVNRGKYSEPKDLLVVPFEREGVLSFKVGSLPAQLESGDGERRFRFGVKHVPVWNNYAHSELQIWEGDRLLRRGENTTRGVRNDFRTHLEPAVEILMWPD